MKKLLMLVLVVFVGVAVWRVGSRLSSDALGMSVGLFFGILAGVPTALLVMASGRRKEERDENPRRGQGQQSPHGLPTYGTYPQQPPVIVVNGHGGAPQGGPQPGANQWNGQPFPALPGPAPAEERRYRVVGEKDEWIDEY